MAGMFDFLNVSNTGAQLIDPVTSGAGGGGGFDFKALLSDPNFLQALGNAGQAFSQGQPAGVALNPANTIRQIQGQKAGASQAGDIKQMQSLLKQLLSPTPKGMAGPDAVTVQNTADGTTMTVKSPSERNLQTYGTSVPAEAVPAGPGNDASVRSPFLGALFGLG